MFGVYTCTALLWETEATSALFKNMYIKKIFYCESFIDQKNVILLQRKNSNNYKLFSLILEKFRFFFFMSFLHFFEFSFSRWKNKYITLFSNWVTRGGGECHSYLSLCDQAITCTYQWWRTECCMSFTAPAVQARAGFGQEQAQLRRNWRRWRSVWRGEKEGWYVESV